MHAFVLLRMLGVKGDFPSLQGQTGHATLPDSSSFFPPPVIIEKAAGDAEAIAFDGRTYMEYHNAVTKR